MRQFKDGALPTLPIKKLLVLLWKTLLITLGGFDDLTEAKRSARKEAGLPLSPAINPAVRPKPATAPGGTKGAFPKPEPNLGATPHGFPPKASQADVDAYRAKMQSTFYGYMDPATRTVGPPPAAREALRVLEARVYTSLGSVQRAREEAIIRDARLLPTVVLVEHGRTGPVEELYQDLLPEMQRTSIALLRIMLAALPQPPPQSPARAAMALQQHYWLTLQGELRPPGSAATVAEAAIDTMDELRLKVGAWLHACTVYVYHGVLSMTIATPGAMYHMLSASVCILYFFLCHVCAMCAPCVCICAWMRGCVVVCIECGMIFAGHRQLAIFC